MSSKWSTGSVKCLEEEQERSIGSVKPLEYAHERSAGSVEPLEYPQERSAGSIECLESPQTGLLNKLPSSRRDCRLFGVKSPLEEDIGGPLKQIAFFGSSEADL